jgi:hypothetical protein
MRSWWHPRTEWHRFPRAWRSINWDFFVPDLIHGLNVLGWSDGLIPVVDVQPPAAKRGARGDTDSSPPFWHTCRLLGSHRADIPKPCVLPKDDYVACFS